MQEGELESTIVKKIEVYIGSDYARTARYRYIPEADLDNPIR